jgi:hypothetical protein
MPSLAARAENPYGSATNSSEGNVMKILLCVFVGLFTLLSIVVEANERPRARDIGLVVGIFPTGPLNAITDVDGVRVGHATRIEGDDIRTGSPQSFLRRAIFIPTLCRPGSTLAMDTES